MARKEQEPWVRTPQQSCPACGHSLNAVGQLGETEVPQPAAGDVTVCLACCAVLMFDHKLILTKVDERFLDPETRAEVRVIKQSIRAQQGFSN